MQDRSNPFATGSRPRRARPGVARLAAVVTGIGIGIGIAGLLAPGAVAADPWHDPDPSTLPSPTSVELTIEALDGSRMNGHLYVAAGAGPHPTVVLLHGLPGHERNLDVAQALRRDGWNVLFFHYRGAWGSEGRYRFTHLEADVVAALDRLTDAPGEWRVDPARLSLVGHSVGGFAALTAARDPRVRCAVGIAPADLARYRALGQTDRIRRYADSLGMLAGFDGAHAAADLARLGPDDSLAARITALAVPVLVITGTEDRVPVPEFDRIGRRDGFTHVSLAGADHGFSGHRIALIDRVAGWLDGHCR